MCVQPGFHNIMEIFHPVKCLESWFQSKFSSQGQYGFLWNSRILFLLSSAVQFAILTFPGCLCLTIYSFLTSSGELQNKGACQYPDWYRCSPVYHVRQKLVRNLEIPLHPVKSACTHPDKILFATECVCKYPEDRPGWFKNFSDGLLFVVCDAPCLIEVACHFQ